MVSKCHTVDSGRHGETLHRKVEYSSPDFPKQRKNLSLGRNYTHLNAIFFPLLPSSLYLCCCYSVVLLVSCFITRHCTENPVSINIGAIAAQQRDSVFKVPTAGPSKCVFFLFIQPTLTYDSFFFWRETADSLEQV